MAPAGLSALPRLGPGQASSPAASSQGCAPSCQPPQSLSRPSLLRQSWPSVSSPASWPGVHSLLRGVPVEASICLLLPPLSLLLLPPPSPLAQTPLLAGHSPAASRRTCCHGWSHSHTPRPSSSQANGRTREARQGHRTLCSPHCLCPAHPDSYSNPSPGTRREAAEDTAADPMSPTPSQGSHACLAPTNYAGPVSARPVQNMPPWAAGGGCLQPHRAQHCGRPILGLQHRPQMAQSQAGCSLLMHLACKLGALHHMGDLEETLGLRPSFAWALSLPLCNSAFQINVF